MQIVYITDTHIGARSGSSIFREYFRWYFGEILFPYMEQNGITELHHGGDFFDDRNHIKLPDIDFCTNWFAPELIKRGITLRVVLGNHDVAFRNTNSVHSLTILKAAAPNNVIVYEEPTLEIIGGQRFAMIPWINSSNYDATMQFINKMDKKDETIILGHFEIVGAKMYANSMRAEHGLDAIHFKGYQSVLSGHFHHKSDMENVKYLGSTFHLTWQDYGDQRGFHVFDTDTKAMTLVENEHCLFVAVAFDKEIFSKMTDAEYQENFGERFVRLVVTDPNYDRVALMDTVSKIQRTKPHDLQIQNDTILNCDENKDSSKENEMVMERTSRSTKDYIESYVMDRFEEDPDGTGIEVMTILDRLYLKASDLQTKGE